LTKLSGNNWKLLATNWSWVISEIVFSDSWKFLKSNWASALPTFESITIDINILTNDEALGASDKLIFYKNWVWNRKRTALASETIPWLVERATNAEATAWTDTTRYITPKQAKDNYWVSRSLEFTRIIQSWTWESAEIIAGTKEILLNYYLSSVSDSSDDEYASLWVYNGSVWTLIRESNDGVVTWVIQQFIFGSYFLQPWHKAKIVCVWGNEQWMIEYQSVS
jgi:hypothetical protein